jgi:hypothetical protein
LADIAMKKILFATLFAATLAASFAADAKPAVNYKQTLSAVTVLEMPATAASLVTKAEVKDREVVTASVVNTAANIKPTALPAVVGAIAKATPEMAPTAAAVGAAAQPKLAREISKAAAAAAPDQAMAIVAAVTKALPATAKAVALAVAEVAPDSAKALRAQAEQVTSSTTAAADSNTGSTRPPTVNVPYNPLPGGTIGTGSVTNSGTVGGGGRDYSSP